MQSIKSTTARKVFKEYSEIKKQLCVIRLKSNWDYIGTAGDGTTSKVPKNDVQNQGKQK
jgi:REP element-mobilizing transposase RayT